VAVRIAFYFGVNQINGDLEDRQPGDGIARRTKRILPGWSRSICRWILRPWASLRTDDRTALQSLSRRRCAAGRVGARDGRRNRPHESLRHDDLLRLIQEQPRYAQTSMNGILVAKNLERIADHAANIATDVVLLGARADLRHQLSLSTGLMASSETRVRRVLLILCRVAAPCWSLDLSVVASAYSHSGFAMRLSERRGRGQSPRPRQFTCLTISGSQPRPSPASLRVPPAPRAQPCGQQRYSRT